MATRDEYTAFVRRAQPRKAGSFFAGGDGDGRFLSQDWSPSGGDGHGAGYSPAYDVPQWPTSIQGRFAGFMQRGNMFRPFTLPLAHGRPINAQYPLVDGVDLGRIRALPGLATGKFGIIPGARVPKGREQPVWMDRAVWARRPPQSLTARVIR